MASDQIVQKLWNYRNVLRDDGMSYGDYVEQLTYLLFLKMADERTQAPYNQPSIGPKQYSWSSLIKKDGDELFDQFSGSRCPALARKPGPWLLPRAFGGTEVHRTSFFSRLTHHALDALGKEKGLLGQIFNKAQNKLDSRHPWRSPCGRASRVQTRSRRVCQDPAKLSRLLETAPAHPRARGIRTSCPSKYAQDTKSGAGQYFTSRALMDSAHPWASAFGRASLVQSRSVRNCRSRRNCQAMVDVMAPEPGDTIANPGCGTDGFLRAA